MSELPAAGTPTAAAAIAVGDSAELKGVVYSATPDTLVIESLNAEAQGIARRPDGKVVFVEGALTTECVSVRTQRSKSTWEQATVHQIYRESSQRVEPGCPNFGLHVGACGGCKMQHLHIGAQVASKQRVLEDALWHLSKLRPQNVMRPIEGPTWGYRHRARLSVRYVRKRETVLVGFHERKSRYVTDMQVCPILPQQVEALLMPLRSLIGSLDARETIPQIELARGDSVTALVLRHLEPLSTSDLAALRLFAGAHGVQWWLQPKGPETVSLLEDQGAQDQLAYALPAFGVTMPFRPTDFTQVNPFINRVLVDKALQLLQVQPTERVIDWFCGLGNFTLPLATRAGSVLGIEGSDTLVQRAQENYEVNKAQAHSQNALAATKFAVRNLFEMSPEQMLADGEAQKWLIDPPREGAFALVKALAELHRASGATMDLQADGTGVNQILGDALSADGTSAQNTEEVEARAQSHKSLVESVAVAAWKRPQRIVYVSCNPATLARDAGVLVHLAGYRLSRAGVVNMFAHTSHVESIAVFDRVDATAASDTEKES
jgi:23S rRNA (uracil1939-C5)-methyltransferase